MQGTVKFFDEEKGFGFIRRVDGADKDVFLHARGLANRDNPPKKGDTVQFEIEESKRGPVAVNCTVLQEMNEGTRH